MRSPDMRKPARGGLRDQTWRADRGSFYKNQPLQATLPPLVDLHLGGDFLSGFAAGRAM